MTNGCWNLCDVLRHHCTSLVTLFHSAAAAATTVATKTAQSTTTAFRPKFPISTAALVQILNYSQILLLFSYSNIETWMPKWISVYVVLSSRSICRLRWTIMLRSRRILHFRKHRMSTLKFMRETHSGKWERNKKTFARTKSSGT